MVKTKDRIFLLVDIIGYHIKKIWLGKQSLSVTFWVVSLLGNCLFLSAFGMIYDNNEKLGLIFLLALPIYFIFSIKSLWSCFYNYDKKKRFLFDISSFVFLVGLLVVGAKIFYSGEVVEIYDATIVDYQYSAGKKGIILAVVRLDTGVKVKAWCSHKQNKESVKVEKRASVIYGSKFEYICIDQVN